MIVHNNFFLNSGEFVYGVTVVCFSTYLKNVP